MQLSLNYFKFKFCILRNFNSHQVTSVGHKLISSSDFSYNDHHWSTNGRFMYLYCQKSAKTCSHLSSHELSQAWRKRESGDQQGDQCGIHQAPDRKGWTAGSLMGGVSHGIWILESGRTIISCLWWVTQFICFPTATLLDILYRTDNVKYWGILTHPIYSGTG